VYPRNSTGATYFVYLQKQWQTNASSRTLSGMARPCKPLAEKRSVKVVLHLTRAEKKKLDALARQESLPVATLTRLRALLGLR